MANYYTLFSEEFVGLSADEAHWFEKFLGTKPMNIDPENPRDGYEREWLQMLTEGQVNPEEFMVDAQVQKNEDGTFSLWVYSEESNDPYHAAILIQRFLRTWRYHDHNDDEFFISWAETCSKPRVGQFGGGLILVTKQDIKTVNTHSMKELLLKP